VRRKRVWLRETRSPQEQTIHINCLELLAATLAVQTFAQGEIKHINSSENKQHDHSSIHKQKREDSVPDSFRYGKDAMVVVHGEKHLIGSPASTRSHELHCRQRIQSLARQVRVETLTEHILKNQLPARSPYQRTYLQVAYPISSRNLSAGNQTLWPWRQMRHFYLPQKVYANSPWNLIGIVLSQVYNQSISELILIAPTLCFYRGWSEYQSSFPCHQRWYSRCADLPDILP